MANIHKALDSVAKVLAANPSPKPVVIDPSTAHGPPVIYPFPRPGMKLPKAAPSRPDDPLTQLASGVQSVLKISSTPNPRIRGCCR